MCLRRRKSICVLNFDETSQSTAKVNLLPVSENGRPPYWNCISGINFDLCIVIGMPFCTCLPIFSRWWPAAILDLIWVTLYHPRNAIVGLSLVLKFGLDAIFNFGDTAIFIFCLFGLKLLIHAHLGRGGLEIYSPNMVTHRSSPQKDHPCAETRCLSHKA